VRRQNRPNLHRPRSYVALWDPDDPRGPFRNPGPGDDLPATIKLMRVALAVTALALGLAAPALAAVQRSNFLLHVGQTRTFVKAQTGDRITCKASSHSVTVTVPPRHEGAFKQRTITPTRRLAVNVGRNTHGHVWALCRWR
jgi:hypothetical protein